MTNLTSLIFNDFNENILIVIIIGIFLICWVVLLEFRLRKINRKFKNLFQGSQGRNLEEIILKQSKDIKKLESDTQDLFKINEEIHRLAAHGIQKIGVVRFNPFSDVGSDQSFSIALLDFYNNGLVISSLYTREGTRIYTKPIKNSSSEYQLSEEEKEAIGKAMGNFK